MRKMGSADCKEHAKAQAVIVTVVLPMHVPVRKDLATARRQQMRQQKLLELNADGVLIGSTGVIGMQLPIDRIVAGVKAAC